MPRSKFTAEAKALLDSLEGNKLEAYQDDGGIWTVGRGSTRDVTPGMVISEAESDERFERDICDTCSAVDGVLGEAPLNSNQYSAFVIFAFNVRSWQTRPLTAHVKAGDTEGASAHWLLYDKETIDGVKTEVQGLLNRRKAELALYQSPVV